MPTNPYPPLPVAFYERETAIVAKALIGKILVRKVGQQTLAGIIVETEAYHANDPASHAFRGKTPRNAPMFEAAGCAYVYFIYGNYFCLNAVTEPDGIAGAVLIRALEPLEGIPFMVKQRHTEKITQLTNGPGKICQAMAIDSTLNRHTLNHPPLLITKNHPHDQHYNHQHYQRKIKTSPRIGIRLAATDPLRFYVSDNPHISYSSHNGKGRAS